MSTLHCVFLFFVYFWRGVEYYASTSTSSDVSRWGQVKSLAMLRATRPGKNDEQQPSVYHEVQIQF